MIRKRRFAKYDHGPERNLELYGQVEFPDYDLRNVPGEKVSIITGTADRLSTIEDNEESCSKFRKPERSLNEYHANRCRQPGNRSCECLEISQTRTHDPLSFFI